MAFLDTTKDQQLPLFYNVTRGVGYWCPNEEQDVRLVQYLLQTVYAKVPWTSPKGKMKVDGKCGPITENWILKFQLDLRGQKQSVTADRRVDRVRDNKVAGSFSKTIYTLLWLNHMAQRVDPLAFAKVPDQVQLTPIGAVPPPKDDFIVPQSLPVPAVGGL
ncbi:MAG: hypothetical protein SFV54_06855 [Bryobacteraceae bacterium]|nr:hypothetical protein [Bryobacteraceae bacterium]